MGARNRVGIGFSYWPARYGIFKLLRGPGIDVISVYVVIILSLLIGHLQKGFASHWLDDYENSTLAYLASDQSYAAWDKSTCGCKNTYKQKLSAVVSH
jgi:hypothetical protein